MKKRFYFSFVISNSPIKITDVTKKKNLISIENHTIEIAQTDEGEYSISQFAPDGFLKKLKELEGIKYKLFQSKGKSALEASISWIAKIFIYPKDFDKKKEGATGWGQG